MAQVDKQFNKNWLSKLKIPAQSSGIWPVVFLLVASLIGLLIYKSFAAAPLVAKIQAERMKLPIGGFIYKSATASGGQAVKLTKNGTISGAVDFPSSVTSMNVIAKQGYCQGYPTMKVLIDGKKVWSGYVKANSWHSYNASFAAAYNPGKHSLVISFTNDSSKDACDVNRYVDVTNFYGPNPPPASPVVAISASPITVSPGQSSTLTWTSANATSCTASGAWSGAEPTKGSTSTGAINKTSTYTLACTGAGGSATANTTVTVTAPPSSSIYWGAWMEGKDTYTYYYGTPAPDGNAWATAPWGNTGNTWDRFEQNAGKKVTIDHFGQPNMWSQQTFDGSIANIITNRGAIPLIDYSSDTTPLTEIASGQHDPEITTWANSVKAWGKPFFLRWDWEMNGTWFPWGSQAQASPADFVKSWQHLHDVIDKAGAKNVTWVWCPNLDGGSSTPIKSLYPGDSYVDWTCLDGYNQESSSQSFYNLYKASYDDVLSVAPTKPMMIGEVGSYEYSGAKASWITDMLTKQLPTNFPQIKAVVWFNWRIYENGKYKDWPIESSGTSQAAFKAGISSNYYQAGNSALTSLPLLTKVPIP